MPFALRVKVSVVETVEVASHQRHHVHPVVVVCLCQSYNVLVEDVKSVSWRLHNIARWSSIAMIMHAILHQFQRAVQSCFKISVMHTILQNSVTEYPKSTHTHTHLSDRAFAAPERI